MRRRFLSSLVRLAQRESVGGSGVESKTVSYGYARHFISRIFPDQSIPSHYSRGQDANILANVWRRRFSTTTGWDSVLYPESELKIGSPAPDFSLEAIINGENKTVNLSDYKGKYVILFWYPKDFTFVCPTEIIAFNDRAKEFEDLNCQLLAASTDSPEVHLAWIKTPRKQGGLGFMQIPILADITKAVAARYGVLNEDQGIALRGLYIINPEGIVEHATINNFPIGRSVDEALRTLQAIQHVAEYGEVCPAGWKPGDMAMIADPEKSLDYFQAIESDPSMNENKSDSVMEIKNVQEFQDLVKSGAKVVVKFWAPWCGKCRQLAPFVEDMAEKYSKEIQIVSIDTTDENLESFCSDMGVKGLPAFRFYCGGQEKEELRLMGYKKQLFASNLSTFVE